MNDKITALITALCRKHPYIHEEKAPRRAWQHGVEGWIIGLNVIELFIADVHLASTDSETLVGQVEVKIKQWA